MTIAMKKGDRHQEALEPVPLFQQAVIHFLPVVLSAKPLVDRSEHGLFEFVVAALCDPL